MAVPASTNTAPHRLKRPIDARTTTANCIAVGQRSAQPRKPSSIGQPWQLPGLGVAASGLCLHIKVCIIMSRKTSGRPLIEVPTRPQGAYLCGDGDGDVLANLAAGGLRDAHRAAQPPQVRREQHHIGRVDGHISARRAHGHACTEAHGFVLRVLVLKAAESQRWPATLRCFYCPHGVLNSC